MDLREACLACLRRGPTAMFEAALWIAAEHDPLLRPRQVLAELEHLRHRVAVNLPSLPPRELAQPLLRQLCALDFQEDEDIPLSPHAALIHQVLRRRRGQPLSLALLALEIARRLDIPLHGVNFPGRVLLRVPGADHLLDPCTGRRLYAGDCRELLRRQFGKVIPLHADHLRPCDAHTLLQRLSRNLRELHLLNNAPLAALKDAERVLLLGPPSLADHLARADIYQLLDCPEGARYDLQHALLLCDDPGEHLRLNMRLRQIKSVSAVH